MEESQGKAQEKEVLNFADPEIRCISTPQLGGVCTATQTWTGQETGPQHSGLGTGFISDLQVGQVTAEKFTLSSWFPYHQGDDKIFLAR